ncbi:hypothetical protein GCM10028772_30570 [Nocardioides ultimimeridianus]
MRAAIGGGALFASVAVMGALSVPTGYAVAALLVLSASLCLVLPLAHAALVAGAGWALTDGFELNRFGQIVPNHTALLLLGGFAVALLAGRPLRGVAR